MRHEEDLLEQVLGFVSSDQPARESEQTRGVLSIQLFKRAGRVLAAAFRQGQIRVPFHVKRFQ